MGRKESNQTKQTKSKKIKQRSVQSLSYLPFLLLISENQRQSKGTYAYS